LYKIRIEKTYCWDSISNGKGLKVWVEQKQMLPFIQQMVMGTNYLLSTDTRDTEIIPSPSSKEPMDYEGRQKSKFWYGSFNVISLIFNLLSTCYWVGTVIDTGDREIKQTRHGSYSNTAYFLGCLWMKTVQKLWYREWDWCCVYVGQKWNLAGTYLCG